MSTPQEFRRVADELAQLRTAIEEMADHFERDMGWNGVSLRLRELLDAR